MASPQHLLIDIARLTLWLALLAAIFVPLERALTLSPRAGRRADLAADLGFYFLSSLLPALILSLPLSLMVAIAHRIVPGGYYDWLDATPLWARLVASFVIGEIGFYWGHRLSHETPSLWHYHAVHHRPERLDWLVNTRAHPVDMVFGKLCGLAPLYLIGLAGRGAGEGNAIAIAVTLLGTIWGFLLHANVRLRLGPLERLIASPAFHHWHHDRAEALGKNYASMLPPVDWLFGTLHLPKRFPDSYGVIEATPPVRRTRRPASAARSRRAAPAD